MIDSTPTRIESFRPTIGALEAVNHCLQMLYKDDRRALEDLIVPGLTFEELLGTLLLVRDRLVDAAPDEGPPGPGRYCSRPPP
jgi:hypothetical protein